jgi:hypothetical protein
MVFACVYKSAGQIEQSVFFQFVSRAEVFDIKGFFSHLYAKWGQYVTPVYVSR